MIYRMTNLIQEFREAILTFPNCDCSTIGKLTALVKKYEDKRVIIAEPGDVVVVLDREEGQMMIEEFAKHEMLLPANILISIRQQLEEGK